jgi:hypothetical protein
VSDSPLSDAMAEYAQNNTSDAFARFLSLFRSTTVGFVAVGAPSPSGGDVGAGRTTYGDGLTRILAYADPEVAWRNFGPRFNAGMSGEVFLQMAATDPECHGILVNSATQEISVIIDKPTAEAAYRAAS